MTNDQKALIHAELVINALHYAQNHNLDINNPEDVKNIFEAVDPDNKSTLSIEEFMTLLQNGDTFLEMTAKKRIKPEEKLSN